MSTSSINHVLLDGFITEVDTNIKVARAFIYIRGTERTLDIVTHDYIPNIVNNAISKWGVNIEIECETAGFAEKGGIR